MSGDFRSLRGKGEATVQPVCYSCRKRPPGPVAIGRCDVCLLEDRVRHAEESAAQLPGLRAKLRKAQGLVPQMALRPDYRFPEELDDIVVKDVRMFRAEAMSDDCFWMACYFGDNHERITFNVQIGKSPKRIVVTAGEMPDDWIDIDAELPEKRMTEAEMKAMLPDPDTL